MRGGRRRLRVTLLLLIAIGTAALGVLAYATNAFRSLELNTVDTRFSVRGTEKPPSNIVVVEIDDPTFTEVGQQWPFSHDVHGKLIDKLRRDGAKTIAMDIQFPDPPPTDKEAFALLDSIHRAGNVVESTTKVDELGNGNAFNYVVPQEVLESKKPHAVNDWLRREYRVELSWGNFPPDVGGVLRRVEYANTGVKSFPVIAAEKATGKRIDPKSVGGDTAWIDFYGPPRTIEHVEYADVLYGRTKPGTFRGKIVVVGATAPVLHDVHPSSTSGEGEMSGPEIQASAIGTVLAGFPLQETSKGLDIFLIVLMGSAIPLLSLRLRALPALGIAIAVGGVYTVVAQLAFDGGKILPFVYPLGSLTLAAIGALAVYYLTEAIERERTRDMFARFVPASVVGQALEQADGLRLGGVGREATVMFSDLRGFTSFAESLEPDRVITILNRYLAAMVDDAIMPHGGTLVDYMGDGIMAVFGAPVEMDDHADRALAAARDKLEELAKFNQWLHAEYGFDKSFQMGIGLNSGRVMSGNVGSEQRMAYTAIGDTTNTAARLEAMTKGTPYMVLMSDATRERLSEEPKDLVFFDEVEVRGREQKVRLWTIGESVKENEPAATFQSVAKKAPQS